MKIVFVSGCAPAIFNTDEPNSYPYYLIKELAKDHQLCVLYFNANQRLTNESISKGLADGGVDQHIELKPSSAGKALIYARYSVAVLLTKLFLAVKIDPPKFLVPVPLSAYKKKPPVTLVQVVKEFKPDLVIFFPQLLQFAVKQVAKLGVPVSVLFTDSGVLHFARLMDVKGPGAADRKRNYQQLLQYQKLEKIYSKIPASYFFVGQKDRETFVSNSKLPGCSFFLPHHLYTYSSYEKKWGQNNAPLQVVFAGGGHTVYTGDEADRIATKIVSSNSLPPSLVQFHFLGKGYAKAIESLRAGGYTVTHQQWVENYDEFMAQMDIQVFPIIVGTGTKAKVLSAMSSGLLCIGTWYSFENIQANPDQHYLQYDQAAEIPGLLLTVCQNREHYARVAANGRLRILEMHDTGKVVRQLLADSPR